MAEHQQDGFFREIDEELRQEHYAKLWKRYGKYIIGGAAVFVSVVAGYQGWRTYDINNRQELGERFAKAQVLLMENKGKDADKIFSSMAIGSNAGYAALARFQRAALAALESGNVSGFGGLAGDGGIDAIYRDLAMVLGAMHEIDGANSGELMGRLAPLTAEDNPWRYSAREVIALIALKTGDTGKAQEMLKGLAEDATAPQGMRERAKELSAAIGG